MRISLVGRVKIEFDDTVVDEAQLAGRQGRLLFAYLVAEHRRPVPRDELAEALWGETPPVTWEKALGVLASKLRRLLADNGVGDPSVLTAAFGCYRLELPAGAWVDVIDAASATDAAERALDTGDLAVARERATAATALLQQPFLPGEDGAWVEAKRRELTGVRERALATLADASVRATDAAAAAAAAEQLIALAPLRESGYRRLMEAHAAAGNRAEALEVYERCRKLLADELGAYPSPETEAIYRDLLVSPAVPGARVVDDAEATPETTLSPRRRGAGRRVAVGLAVCAIGAAVTGFAVGRDNGPNLPDFQAIESAGCSALHYDGPGSPQLVIAADLPLQAGALETTTPMVNAITLALERRDYAAGEFRVGLQFCGGVPAGNTNDPAACGSNARAYVKTPSVVGVIGPFSSGCAVSQIPILGKAARGALAMVSPTATYVGLTRSAPGVEPGEPDAYYPTGTRNFARVLPTDDVQAAAGALASRELGMKRVYVLDIGDPPSMMFADAYLRAAERLGIASAGRGVWDLEAASADGIATTIAETAADGVFLAVPSVPASVRLVTAIRERLGPDVQLMAPDAFAPETALLAGRSAEGMAFTSPGPSSEDVPAAGEAFVAAYEKRFGEVPTPYALAAAQATDLLLEALAASDGTRASTTRSLFRTRLPKGILGDFWITPTGDTSLNAVTVRRIAGGKITAMRTVTVPDALVVE